MTREAPAGAARPALISDAMRAAIGSRVHTRKAYPIDASAVRRWAVAVYFPEVPPAPFWRPDGGDEARLAVPAEFNPFAWTDRLTPAATDRPRRECSVEELLGLAPVPLSGRLNGGQKVRYGVPMRVGDVILAEEYLIDYTERSGRRGALLFTTTEERWTNQDGQLVKSLQNTQIRL